MWKANGKTTTLKLFLDSFSPKREKLSFEEAMDLSRDRLILELEDTTEKQMLNCSIFFLLHFGYRLHYLDVTSFYRSTYFHPAVQL
jgi:hypothetical protein